MKIYSILLHKCVRRGWESQFLNGMSSYIFYFIIFFFSILDEHPIRLMKGMGLL